jgi:putative ABC transport system permease protein
MNQYLEVIKMSLSALRENMLRTMLTMLAIVVGVFAIIGSVTAVLVLDTYFNDTLNVMGGNVINISKYPGVTIGGNSEYRNRNNITFDHFERLKERAVLGRYISPEEWFSNAKISYGEEETDPNVAVKGSSQHYLRNYSYEIADGRNFTQDDVDKGRSVVLVGETVRAELFPNQNALGKQLLFDGRKYTIIGLLDKKSNTLGSDNNNFVLIPYTTALNAYGGNNRNIDIFVSAPDVRMVDATMDELIGLMRTIRKVEAGTENDFEISTNDSLKGVFESFTGYLYLFGFIVGGISLLGAGIGVMNIMLVSVTERTREIGIRKAIGATRKMIIQQFLAEAIMICQLGGLIGLLIGVIGGNILAVFMETQVVFPWSAAFGGIIGLTFIGLLFGVYPAVKASKLDPIESLRYE